MDGVGLCSLTGSQPFVAENPSVPQPGLEPMVMSFHADAAFPYLQANQSCTTSKRAQGVHPRIKEPERAPAGTNQLVVQKSDDARDDRARAGRPVDAEVDAALDVGDETARRRYVRKSTARCVVQSQVLVAKNI